MVKSIELTDKLTKELDNIYGIENSKNQILDYIKYSNICMKTKIANLNIIINNRCIYKTESKEKLKMFLYNVLLKKGIIKEGFKEILGKEIKDYLKDNYENKDTKIKKDKKEEIKSIKEDLVIILSDKRSGLDSYIEDIVELMKENKNKIFIIINENERFAIGEINAMLNPYFDWHFDINIITEQNKKDYMFNLFNENGIKYEGNIDKIKSILNENLYIIKNITKRIVLDCKLTEKKEINEKDLDKYNNDAKNNIVINKKVNTLEDLTFENLIGMDNVKYELNKIINYLKICKKRKINLPMLHMCFTGNPGTGKTTVARMLGQIFKEENILSTGTFLEIHGRDLIGKYVGWTSKQVKEIIDKAIGGILFIDEVYSLNSAREGGFEDEAITTLLKEMEDKRNDLCIILAGYKNETMDLIKRNPGFESRIQFYLNFNDYNEEELYNIFNKLAIQENFQLSSDIKQYLEKELNKYRKLDNFSNARFIRNIFEKTKIEQANRIINNNEKDINLIEKEDIINVLKNIEEKENIKIKLGFRT